MKDTAPWIFLFILLAFTTAALLSNDILIDGLKERVPFALNTTPRPIPTLSGPNAAAEATRVAQEQSAIMTVNAAQGELQATTQAGIVQGTRQAVEADQIQRDQEATRQAEATAQAIQVTVERERFVATATSAAEATKAWATALVATATRQAREDDIAATANAIQITVEAKAAEEAIYTIRIEKAAIERRELKELFVGGLVPLALFGLVFNFTVGPVIGLLCILLHIWREGKK